MRSIGRFRFLLFFALTLVLWLLPIVGASASVPAGYWIPRGRVLDAESGMPASGVRYIIYSWNPATRDLVEDGAGWTGGTGRFSGCSPNYRPWAIVVFDGGGRFFDQYWGGLRTDFIVKYVRGLHFPTVIVPSGDMLDAKRLSGGHGGYEDFGDTYLQTAPQPYGMLAGRVTDRASGAGLSNFDLYTWRYDDLLGVWRRSQWSETTMPDGSFYWRGGASSSLLSGIRLEYHVYTPQGWVSRFYPGSTSVNDAVTLDLKAGDVLGGLDMKVDVPNRFRGTIMQTESKTPLENADVAQCTQDPVSGEWERGGGPDSSATGDYWMPEAWGLKPGDYRIAVLDRSETYRMTYYGQTRSVNTATTIHLEQGQTIDGLDVWMSNVPAVAGTVLDSVGSRRPDVLVTAYRRSAEGELSEVGSDYSDTNGRYRVLVGSAGDYTLRFTDRAGTFDTVDDVTLYLGGGTELATATTVRVSARDASVPSPFVLPVAPAPASDRVAASTDCASAIAASRADFPDVPTSFTASGLDGVSPWLVGAAVGDAASIAPTVVLTAAGHYPEALCAAGLAGSVRGPVLLTKTTEFQTGLIRELARLGAKRVYVVGSKGIVPERQLRLLCALGYSVERISGEGRFEIAASVARKIASVSTVTSRTPVFVASGYSEADGFIVAPAAYASRGVVLFVGKTSTPKVIASVAKSLGLRAAYAVGDTRTLPSSSLSGLTGAGVRVTRGSTSTSAYTRAASFARVASQRGWLSSDTAGLVCLSSLSQSLASPAALGHAGAPLLFVTKTSLTTQTADLLKSRSTVLDIVHVFSRASTVGTKVLLSAGSL